MLAVALLLTIGATPALADESAGLKLPPGFHATVVADELGSGARHIAVRDNGDVYVSTRPGREATTHTGVIAVKVDTNYKVVRIEHFSNVDGGTGMRLYKGALYVAGGDAIYRFEFKGNELVPSAAPKIAVANLPSGNMGIAFDDTGHLYTTVRGAGNICVDPKMPKGGKPVGLLPCPLLVNGGGMWRFNAEKTNQKFPTDGEQFATGIRDMTAVDWSTDLKGIYGVMQGRNGTAALVPGMSEDSDTVAEEMHRIDRGTNLGWPYTYYDTALRVRVMAPEYGGDGKSASTEGNYSNPVVAFGSHQSPVDLQFYNGKQFPLKYRGGAFVAFQGGSGPFVATGRSGYNLTFVPFDKSGNAGTPEVFADDFAGPDAADRNSGKALFRPSGIAVAPDGSLYVVDTVKGRLWHITYDGKR
jgi:glucose/arabinose dehydrogenase